MASSQFEICPKTYSFFHNIYERNIKKKYFILEGYYRYLPFWHDAYDEDTIFYYNHVGTVEIHKGKTIKVISRIDGGYPDENDDYYVHLFSNIESENENGVKSKLPKILESMFDNMKMYEDIPKGTIFN